MRILVLSNLYPSPRHPAFGTFVAARVAALRAAGASVDLVAIHDPAARRRVVRKYASLSVRAIAFATLARARGKRVDVVEAHIAYPTGLVARPVARMLGAPLVLFAHGADVLDIPRRSPLHHSLARATFGAARLIVANSHFLAGELRREFPLTADQVIALSPGIELDRFGGPSDDVRPRRGLLFVGRLIAEKGCAILIRAMAAIEPARRPTPFTVMGDGSERRALETLAAELSLDVRFAGPVGPDAVADAMRSSALVVVPSVYREPFGLVALEAMAAGAIVVASATGGLTEIVEDGRNGIAVPPGDVGALTAALERGMSIANDPIEGTRVRRAARGTAERHDVRLIAAESLRLYGTLMA
jgi:glycosyltransferase involved in cell wall biosynthesis